MVSFCFCTEMLCGRIYRLLRAGKRKKALSLSRAIYRWCSYLRPEFQNPRVLSDE